jgi:hypothetical protein
MSKWFKATCVKDNTNTKRHSYEKGKEYYIYDHWHDTDAGETCLDIYGDGKFIETILEDKFAWFWDNFQVIENVPI